MSRYSVDTIFVEISSILKAEMTAAGTVPGDHAFNNEQGDILFKATNIAGFGRRDVSWSCYPWCDALRFL